jgi:aminopeptidase-like protein
MTASITQRKDGTVTAFTPSHKLSMSFSQPSVGWSFHIKDLEEWLTTLEETMDALPTKHRWAMESMYFSLKAAHNRHLEEHNEIITNAPSDDDLQSYLQAYAAFAAGNHK